jgi:hypothetical protein
MEHRRPAEGRGEGWRPRFGPLTLTLSPGAHPPYPEMQKIIQEITAALFEFCIRAA